jgi:serine/threonine-protein kinase
MLAVGTQLGPYQILAPLGAGGMGEVYRARHSRLEREVAIKVLSEDVARDEHRLARFEREAKAVAALSHPNIVAIHDYGTEQGVSFAAMELLEGETLRARVANAALPWRKAVEIGVAVADGLAAAHAKGIIHRDLKPENLFLTGDGQVKILDFGLARVQPPSQTGAETGSYHPAETDPGTILGTVGYMAPEQVRGQAADARSDIFAFGCVLYEMVTGQRPFGRPSSAETQAAILRDEPPSLTHAGKRVPLEVERVVGHCLEKNPEERFQSARDLAFALRATLSDSGIGKSSPLAQPVQRKPQRRRRKVIQALAVLPLVNTSADARVEYLSDGITESIIHTLSHFPKLRVMARSTVFRYKGQSVDPQAVGGELAVQAVVTGKVSLLGDRLTVGIELVDVGDGSLLWGEQYNRKLADLLSIQEEISKEITENLRLKLTGAEKKFLTKRHTEDSDAYQLYLKGRYFWNKRTADGLNKAITCFEQAIAKDPSYALAYAGLADAHNNRGSYSIVPAQNAFPQAKAAAFKALELDEAFAEAHVSLAFAQFMFDWDWSGAGKEFQRALELNAGYANAHHWYAWYLLAIGQLQEALTEMKRARELDPLSLPINTNIGFVYYFARQYDEAIEQFRKALEMDANFAEAHRGLGETFEQKAMGAEAVAELRQLRILSGGSTESLGHLGHAYAVAGKRADAKEVLAELARLSKRQYVSAHDIASIYTALGENAQAFRWLEKAYKEHSYRLAWLKVDPKLDSLRADPRFADLMRRMNFPS